ncbi:hypothetical protein Tco_1001159 [Tanacetum coccineum]
MNTTQAQQKALDDALVAPIDRLEFGKCNMRLKTDINPKEATFQVVSLQEFWATVSIHRSSIRFTINKKKVSPDVEIFRDILQFCPKIPGQVFKDLPLEQYILSFIRDLGHTRDITYLTNVNIDYLHQPWRAFSTVINKCLSGKETGMDKIHLLFQIEYKDAKKTNKMSYPRFTKIIIDYFIHEDTQYIRKKADSDTSPKKKPVQATKGTRLKSKAKVAKPDKKKQLAKKTKAKGLDVLFEVALTEAKQIKLVTKRSKKDFHVSQASGSGDGVDTQSKVPDEQQPKTSGTDEGTGTIPGVPDVPPYESESDKESWGDSDDDDNDDDGDSDDHDDDSDDERTESDRDEIFDPKLTNVDQTEHEEEEFNDEFYEEEEENSNDEETISTNVSQESGFEQVEEDAHVTLTSVIDTQKTGDPSQSSSVSSDFTSKLLNLDNPSLADNEIASLMDTTAQHATVIPEITSSFTTTIPPPPPFLHPLQQEATPTPTPTTFTIITSTNPTVTLPEIPNFASVFKFDQRVSVIESELSVLKQTNQFAKAASSILGIVDSYIASKMKEAVDVAVQLQTNKLREEAQAENQEFLNQVDLTMKKIIKDQVKAQVSKIMPKIEKYVTESLGAEVLVRSTNQPQTAYAVAASLSEFKLKKILIDKMEANKSINRSNNQKNLYNALVESYNSDKDIISSYGDVEVTKADWFKKPERLPTPDPDWSKRQQVDFRPSQTWISQVALAKEPPTSFDEFNDTTFDFSAFVMNWLKIPNLT